MSRCAVCVHPRVADADAALVAGTSDNRVAAMIGVSRHSVNRHVKSGHVPPAPGGASAPPTPPRPGAVDPVASLEALLAELDAEDTSAMSQSQRAQNRDARRRAAADLARMRPAVLGTEGPTQRMLRAVEDMFRVQTEVIDRHPEIRAEVAAALAAWKARRNAHQEIG